MKAVNKQIKENDTELEKVNQLLGKAHKEADAKARKEQLLQEKEVLLPQLEQAQKDAENGAKEPEEIQRLILSIQKEKENLKRYTNLENLLREIENVSKQIEKLETDSIALQNRQKEKKIVLEEKQKEYQTTDSAEKEKAETDFRKEKIDNLYAGVYKNCGNLEFLQTKISELKIQSEQEEQFAKQIKKDLTDLEEKIVSGGNLEIKENSLVVRLQQIQKIEDQQKRYQDLEKKQKAKRKAYLTDFSETGRNKRNPEQNGTGLVLDGQAGILAAGLQDGMPCPVCGSGSSSKAYADSRRKFPQKTTEKQKRLTELRKKRL